MRAPLKHIFREGRKHRRADRWVWPALLAVMLAACGPNDGRENNPASGWEAAPTLAHSGPVTGIAFSPDGALLAAEDLSEKRTVLWDVARQERLTNSVQHSAQFGAGKLAFSPEGTYLAIGGGEGIVQLWDVREWRMFLEAPTARAPFAPGLAFHPVQPLFAAGLVNVQFYNHHSGKELRMLMERPAGRVRSLAFSPDGRWLAMGMQEGAVSLVDFDEGKESARFTGGTQAILSLSFSRDGRRLAAGSDRGEVLLCDVPRRRLAVRFQAHSGPVSEVLFQPGGRSLLSVGRDGAARFWRTKDGHAAGVLGTYEFPLNSAAMSADGRWLAIASERGGILLWKRGGVTP